MVSPRDTRASNAASRAGSSAGAAAAATARSMDEPFGPARGSPDPLARQTLTYIKEYNPIVLFDKGRPSDPSPSVSLRARGRYGRARDPREDRHGAVRAPQEQLAPGRTAGEARGCDRCRGPRSGSPGHRAPKCGHGRILRRGIVRRAQGGARRGGGEAILLGLRAGDPRDDPGAPG